MRSFSWKLDGKSWKNTNAYFNDKVSLRERVLEKDEVNENSSLFLGSSKEEDPTDWASAPEFENSRPFVTIESPEGETRGVCCEALASL